MLPQFGQIQYLLFNVAIILTDTYWSNGVTIWTVTFWSTLLQLPSGQCCHNFDRCLLANVVTFWTVTFWPMLPQYGHIPSGQYRHNLDRYLLVNVPQFGQIPSGQCCHISDRYLPSDQFCHNFVRYHLVNVVTIWTATFWSMLPLLFLSKSAKASLASWTRPSSMAPLLCPPSSIFSQGILKSLTSPIQTKKNTRKNLLLTSFYCTMYTVHYNTFFLI